MQVHAPNQVSYAPAGKRAARKGPEHEGPGAGGGDRRWHRRLQRALPSGDARLVRRDAGREDRTHRRFHLARGGPPAALQHELQRRPAPQVLDRPLPATGRRDRPGGELPPHGQPAPRHQPGADGRVPQLLRHGEHHRRALRADRPQRDRRALAPLQPGWAGGRPLPPARRPRGPGGRDPGAGQGRTRPGCRDQPQYGSHGHRAHPCWRVAGQDDARGHHMRDCGDGHGLLGAAGGCHGRPGPADDPGGAPVPRHRHHPRTGGAQRGGAPRTCRYSRDGSFVLHAGGTPGPDPRALREGRAGLGGGRGAEGLRPRASAAGPRTSGAPHRGRDRAGARLRPRRHQGLCQRPHSAHAGRQPPHRPGLWAAQLLAGGGLRLRHHHRRRRGLAARRLDRQWRALHRHAGGGPPPLRRLRQQALHQGEERGGLFALLRRPLPGRGAPGGAAGQDQPLSRALGRPRRGLGPALRLGAAQLVRTGRHGGTRRLELPPNQLFRARRR